MRSQTSLRRTFSDPELDQVNNSSISTSLAQLSPLEVTKRKRAGAASRSSRAIASHDEGPVGIHPGLVSAMERARSSLTQREKLTPQQINSLPFSAANTSRPALRFDGSEIRIGRESHSRIVEYLRIVRELDLHLTAASSDCPLFFNEEFGPIESLEVTHTKPKPVPASPAPSKEAPPATTAAKPLPPIRSLAKRIPPTGIPKELKKAPKAPSSPSRLESDASPAIEAIAPKRPTVAIEVPPAPKAEVPSAAAPSVSSKVATVTTPVGQADTVSKVPTATIEPAISLSATEPRPASAPRILERSFSQDLAQLGTILDKIGAAQEFIREPRLIISAMNELAERLKVLRQAPPSGQFEKFEARHRDLSLHLLGVDSMIEQYCRRVSGTKEGVNAFNAVRLELGIWANVKLNRAVRVDIIIDSVICQQVVQEAINFLEQLTLVSA